MNSIANYQLYVLDTGGNAVDVLDGSRLLSLSYTRMVNDVATLSFTVLATDPMVLNAFKLDYFVEVYRNGAKEETYQMKYWVYTQDEDREYVIFGGDSLEWMLRDRVIIPENDPLEANGYSTKGGVADGVMVQLVDEQVVGPTAFGIPGIPNLSTAPVFNIGADVFIRKAFQTVLETLQEVSVAGQADFDMVRTSGNAIEFRVLSEGSDKTYSSNFPLSPYVLFSKSRGNILSASLTYDRRQEVSIAIVQAQGIEEDRVNIPVEAPTRYDSIYNNRFTVVDSRSNEDNSSLLDAARTAGYSALRDGGATITLEVQIDINAAGAQYNVDWVLGDRVTAEYAGLRRNFRIMEVQIEVSASNESIQPILKEFAV